MTADRAGAPDPHPTPALPPAEDTVMTPPRIRPRRARTAAPHLSAVASRPASPEDGPALSIVVPAYQEEERIGDTLVALAEHLQRTGRTDAEVVVVAATRPDGTTDRTAAIAREAAASFTSLRLVTPGTRAGKGRDVRVGMLAARGRVRVFMDADLATPLHHLDTALRLAEAGHPAVIGVRDLTSSHRGLRKLISSVGNRLVQLVLLPGIGDTQCGFKLFTAPVAEEVFGRQTIDGWGFDMEVLAISRHLGRPVTTIPVPDWEDVSGGTFSDAPVRAALKTLQDLAQIKWRAVSGGYRYAPAAPYPVGPPAAVADETASWPHMGVAL